MFGRQARVLRQYKPRGPSLQWGGGWGATEGGLVKEALLEEAALLPWIFIESDPTPRRMYVLEIAR